MGCIRPRRGVRSYFDRTQLPHLARATGEILNFLGHDFDHSRHRYPNRDPGDIAWMQKLGAEGNWTIITGDERIRRNPGERAVWQATGLTTFFLQGTWMAAPAEEQAWRLIRGLLRLIETVESERPGTGLSLPMKWHAGRLLRLYSHGSTPIG